MNLYLDFDGVIVDSIKVTYKMMEEEGIDINDTKRVREFYRNLDWFKLLDEIDEINNAIKNIKKLQKTGMYKLYILTTVNSLEEAEAKIRYIRKFGLNIPIICVPKGIDKSQMVDPRNSILVDDYSGNLYPWERSGGIGVKFTNEDKDNGFITISSLSELETPQIMRQLIRKVKSAY